MQVSMTSFLMEPWEFIIPVGKSFLCKDAGTNVFQSQRCQNWKGPKVPRSQRYFDLKVVREFLGRRASDDILMATEYRWSQSHKSVFPPYIKPYMLNCGGHASSSSELVCRCSFFSADVMFPNEMTYTWIFRISIVYI